MKGRIKTSNQKPIINLDIARTLLKMSFFDRLEV